MSTTTLSEARTQNPFRTAKAKLISDLLALTVPNAYPSFPSPADHEGVAGHIREVARIVDGWLAAIGAEVRDNTATSIDSNLFNGSFLGAVDGNETYACEMAGVSVREECRAMRRAS